MTLRTRLLIGYGYLVLLLLLGAGSATLVFQQLARGIDQVFDHNYKSVAAAMTMIRVLDEQEISTLEAMVAQRDLPDHTETDEELIEVLNTSDHAATLAGESEILTDLRASYDQYRETRDILPQLEMGEAPTYYEEFVEPSFKATRSLAYELLRLNQAAMIAADKAAQRHALSAAVWQGLLVTIALVSFGYLSRALQRVLLLRLSELRAVAVSVRTGDRGRRVPVDQEDELADVGLCLNEALDREDQIEAKAVGRLADFRALIVGLLAQWSHPAAIMGIDGEILATTMLERDQRLLLEIAPQIRRAATTLLTRNFVRPEELSTTLSSGGRTLHIKALTIRGERMVGWLVSAV